MTSRDRHTEATRALRVLASICLGSSALSLAPLQGQLPELPTLAGAGLEYISPTGFLQLSFSGRLDLELIHTQDSWAGLIDHEANEGPLPDDLVSCAACHIGLAPAAEGGTHGAHRLRVLADLFVGDHLYGRVEARADRGHVPSDAPGEGRIEQAFVRLSTTSGMTGLQLGRFASPFGAYGRIHLSEADPFLTPPLVYDYRTVMSRTLIPRDGEFFVDWRHRPDLFRKPGAPPVWSVPYQWGATAFGSLGPVELSLSAMNSAPSSGPAAWAWDADRLSDPSWVATARTRLSPSLTVGASYNRGPWLEETIAGTIGTQPDQPAGADPPPRQDFDQELVSVDLGWERGRMTFSAEAMLDRWAIPNLTERPSELSYSVMAQTDLAAGLSLAGRVGYLDFRTVADDLGAASPYPDGRVEWDHDVLRYEASVGYRLSRNLGLLLSGYRQEQYGEDDGDTHFVGARLWWAF